MYSWHLCGDVKVCSCPSKGNAARIYKIHVFLMLVGQPSNWIALLEEGMYSQRKCSSWTEEYPAPSSCRGWQNPATIPSHQTRFDKELCESHGLDFACCFSDTCIKNSLDSVKQRLKRESWWALRFDSSSKMTGSTTCCRVRQAREASMECFSPSVYKLYLGC